MVDTYCIHLDVLICAAPISSQSHDNPCSAHTAYLIDVGNDLLAEIQDRDFHCECINSAIRGRSSLPMSTAVRVTILLYR